MNREIPVLRIQKKDQHKMREFLAQQSIQYLILLQQIHFISFQQCSDDVTMTKFTGKMEGSTTVSVRCGGICTGNRFLILIWVLGLDTADTDMRIDTLMRTCNKRRTTWLWPKRAASWSGVQLFVSSAIPATSAGLVSSWEDNTYRDLSRLPGLQFVRTGRCPPNEYAWTSHNFPFAHADQ